MCYHLEEVIENHESAVEKKRSVSHTARLDDLKSSFPTLMIRWFVTARKVITVVSAKWQTFQL